MKKTSGFTLIELMVVMAIIAILATAGLSAYTNYIKKARDTTRLSMASQIEVAVTSLMASNGGQAPTDSELIAELDAMNFAWMMTPTPSISLTAISHTLEDVLGISYTYALSDPIGGRSVCLDAAGNADEPCRFNYFLFNDGTYAISYGIESENSRTGNFYVVGTTAGIYRGTAPFIGSAPGVGYVPSTVPTITNGGPTTLDDAVDTGGGGNGGTVDVGGTCAVGADCISGTCNSYWLVCTTGENNAACTSDSECRSGYTCGFGGNCTDGSPGTACAMDNTCAEGVSCQSGNCVAPGQPGDSCTNDTECYYNNCGVYAPGCGGLGATCTNDEQCSGVQCGVDGICGGIGSSCTETFAGICVQAYCNNENTCSTGADGETCNSYDDCSSGLCYNYKCGLSSLGESCDTMGENQCDTSYCSYLSNVCTYGNYGDECNYNGGNNENYFRECQSGVCGSGNTCL